MSWATAAVLPDTIAAALFLLVVALFVSRMETVEDTSTSDSIMPTVNVESFAGVRVASCLYTRFRPAAVRLSRTRCGAVCAMNVNPLCA